MKNITVEVTPAQEEFINAISRELGVTRPGEWLLAEAFHSVSMQYSREGHDGIAGSVAALSRFVAHRDLPKIVPLDQLNQQGVFSAPAPATPAEVLSFTTAAEGGKVDITIKVSEDLAALARGFAGFFQQSLEEYVTEALLGSVQADCEASHHEQLPEFEAQRAREKARMATATPKAD